MSQSADAIDLTERQKDFVASIYWDDQSVPHLRIVCSSMGFDHLEAKAIARELIDLGLLRFGPLCCDDGLVNGGGYWLTSRGLDVREVLLEQPA